jgi:hypothetical protein
VIPLIGERHFQWSARIQHNIFQMLQQILIPLFANMKLFIRQDRRTKAFLNGVVAENLETFLALQEQRERTVPKFVEREFRSFLDCGIPSHGFLRVH